MVSPVLITAQPVGFAEHSAGTGLAVVVGSGLAGVVGSGLAGVVGSGLAGVVGSGLAGVHAANIMLATINIDKKTKTRLVISPPNFLIGYYKILLMFDNCDTNSRLIICISCA
jgi:hypothetical protein